MTPAVVQLFVAKKPIAAGNPTPPEPITTPVKIAVATIVLATAQAQLLLTYCTFLFKGGGSQTEFSSE